MKFKLLSLAFLIGSCASASLQASTICPTTATTSTDCNYVIDITAAGSAKVMDISGATSFNSPMTFVDGTSDPGNNGSLVGVVNMSSYALTSLTLQGSDGSTGIFDFSNNGICVYTAAAYCGTAASGYEGPTTTFSNLQSTVLFETNVGTVNFGPWLAPGQSTYFSIEDSSANLNANGGLMVMAATSATPEPGELGLLVLGCSLLGVARLKFRART